MEEDRIIYLWGPGPALEIEYITTRDEGDTIEDTYPTINKLYKTEDLGGTIHQYIRYNIKNSYSNDFRDLIIKEPLLLHGIYLRYRIKFNGQVINPYDKIIEIQYLPVDEEALIEMDIIYNKRKKKQSI